jgi:hypothetical protein
MLFKIEPPSSTDRLLTLCRVQQALFRWAAEVDNTEDDLGTCRAWLIDTARSDFDAEQAEAIFSWVMNAEPRQKALLAFARQGDTEFKKAWVARIEDEGKRFGDSRSGRFIPLEKVEEGDASYKVQTAGKTLLLLFYEEFRKGGLTLKFSGQKKSYSSQDFLADFRVANKGLVLCSFCQVNAYATIGKNDKGKTHVYTDLDHYLPKSLYPHLSIHPYNLIPTCHACNSWRKGDIDPLINPIDKSRLELQEIWLPYHSSGIGRDIFVTLGPYKIINSNKQDCASSYQLTFDGFEVRPVVRDGAAIPEVDQEDVRPHSIEQLKMWIELWDHIYKPRDTWNANAHLIGETLFRRIREFSHFFPANDAENIADKISPFLDELVYYLDHEDVHREPYAMPMLWWLAKMLMEVADQRDQYFADELKKWYGAGLRDAVVRRLYGERVRGLLKQDQK